MKHNEITAIMVDVAMKIHQRWGPGLLESAYLCMMEHDLKKRGLRVEREIAVPLVHDGVTLDVGYRADLIVEDRVIIELKATEWVDPVHKRQLLTYLRLSDKRVGLLINLGAEVMRDGIFRVVNGFDEGSE